MAELMRDADLAIGGAGTTSWERCALGLPTIILIMAENQRQPAQALSSIGAAAVIDCPSLVGDAVKFLAQEGRLADMSKKAAKVTDGNGLVFVID